MQKTIMSAGEHGLVQEASWIDLEANATVEITSEDERFPIEHALGRIMSTGWRAAGTGPQIIRLRFAEPQEINRIQIHVVERAAERMQEIAVFVEMVGVGRQEVRRQQFTFSPHGSTEELEDFAVSLKQVTMLELKIDPDRSHDPNRSVNYASLVSLRLA